MVYALDINGKITECRAKDPSKCRYHVMDERLGNSRNDMMEISLAFRIKESPVFVTSTKEETKKNVCKVSFLEGSSEKAIDMSRHSVIKYDDKSESESEIMYNYQSVAEVFTSIVFRSSNLTTIFPEFTDYKFYMEIGEDNKIKTGTISENILFDVANGEKITLRDKMTISRECAIKKDKTILMPISDYMGAVDSIDQNSAIEFEMKQFGLPQEEIDKLSALNSFYELVSNSDFVMNPGNLLFTKKFEEPKECFKIYPMDFGRCFAPAGPTGQIGGYRRHKKFQIEIDEIYLKSQLKDLKSIVSACGSKYETCFDRCMDKFEENVKKLSVVMY